MAVFLKNYYTMRGIETTDSPHSRPTTYHSFKNPASTNLNTQRLGFGVIKIPAALRAAGILFSPIHNS